MSPQIPVQKLRPPGPQDGPVFGDGVFKEVTEVQGGPNPAGLGPYKTPASRT
jgi:hypothetical protein